MTSIGAEIQGIKQIIVNLPPSFANIKILPGKEGKFLIEGLVTKPAEFVFLKTKLKNYDSVLTYKVSTTDQAVTGIKQILKEKGIALDVSYDNVYAQISLSGVVSDLNVINDLELAISSQFPEIGSMDTNRIYAATDIETDFDKVISANNYAARLHIEKNILNKQITIQGYLSKTDMQALQSSMDKLAKKYNNIVSIDVKVKDIVYALPFKISMVYTGDNPMFVTTDGRKVFQGGSIAGLVVQKITQNEIVFDGDYPLVYSLNTSFVPDEKSDKKDKQENNNNTDLEL